MITVRVKGYYPDSRWIHVDDLLSFLRSFKDHNAENADESDLLRELIERIETLKKEE